MRLFVTSFPKVGRKQWTVQIHRRCDADPSRLTGRIAGLEAVTGWAVADHRVELAGSLRSGTSETWLRLVGAVVIGRHGAGPTVAHPLVHLAAELCAARPVGLVAIGAGQALLIALVARRRLLFGAIHAWPGLYPIAVGSRLSGLLRIEDTRIERLGWLGPTG